MNIKYPQVRVPLVGEDGNAFAIIGRVSRALKEAGVPKGQIDIYVTQATRGDYNDLLATTMEWVDCSGSLDNDDWCDWCEESFEDCECDERRCHECGELPQDCDCDED